jgi:hypothetical protein
MHSGALKGTTFSASYTPKAELFPRLTEDAILTLFKRIKEEI